MAHEAAKATKRRRWHSYSTQVERSDLRVLLTAFGLEGSADRIEARVILDELAKQQLIAAFDSKMLYFLLNTDQTRTGRDPCDGASLCYAPGWLVVKSRVG